jgi:G:T/U-mismatch repair DNA glycosylase
VTITNNKYSDESHPWNWYIPPNAQKLFLGTFPTEKRNRKHDFFYCSATNRFWEILNEVAKPFKEIELADDIIQQRKILLERLKLGLTDMGRRVYRQQGSSNDHSLFPLEFMNIPFVLSQHPSINTLIVSGGFEGNSSLSWFCTFCSLNQIELDKKQLKKQKATEVVIGDKKYNVLVSLSPSRLSRKPTVELIENYRSFLTNERYE